MSQCPGSFFLIRWKMGLGPLCQGPPLHPCLSLPARRVWRPPLCPNGGGMQQIGATSGVSCWRAHAADALSPNRFHATSQEGGGVTSGHLGGQDRFFPARCCSQGQMEHTAGPAWTWFLDQPFIWRLSLLQQGFRKRFNPGFNKKQSILKICSWTQGSITHTPTHTQRLTNHQKWLTNYNKDLYWFTLRSHCKDSQSHKPSHRITKNHTDSQTITQNYKKSHRITRTSNPWHSLAKLHTDSQTFTQTHKDSQPIIQTHNSLHKLQKPHTDSQEFTTRETDWQTIT